MNNASKYMFSTLILSVVAVAGMAQQDTLTRSVVVEKEFQPVIQSAGKLNIPPKQIDTRVEPVPVEYSQYQAPFQAAYTPNPLAVSSIRFNDPATTDGWLEGAIGHPLTYLDFGYRLRQKQSIVVDLFAHHAAQWGSKTWSKSLVGMRFVKQYSSMELYFNVDGRNDYYTLYGLYYDGDSRLRKTYKDFTSSDRQNLWTVNTSVGVRSRKGEMIQWRVQTGYSAFILPKDVCEHILRSHVDVAWQSDAHKAGVNVFIQNAFYTIESRLDEQMPAGKSATPRHALRIEPFYAYNTERLHLHAGVNIDMNIGRGKLLSTNDNLCFAPSPNITAEYRIIPSWLAVYAGAEGQLGTGLFQTGMYANPYESFLPGVITKHLCPYTPVEATVGIKIKPTNTFLMDFYAKYAVMNNQIVFAAHTLDDLQNAETLGIDARMEHRYGDFRRWTVGAQFQYHYQDIVKIHLGGHYYVWKQKGLDVQAGNPDYIAYEEGVNYGRPSWDIHLRIDANIDSKWSLYSDNIFGGSRKELLLDGSSATLKENIDLRLGVQYNIHRWLSCYLQLNNILNRHNDIFYGYQSLGINGQIGVRWKF